MGSPLRRSIPAPRRSRLGPQGSSPIHEETGRVATLSIVVVDVQLDCDTVRNPRISAFRTITKRGTHSANRVGSTRLDGEGEPVGSRIRYLEGKVSRERADVDRMRIISTSRFEIASIG